MQEVSLSPLTSLRQAMEKQGIQAMWIPHADIHQNEYVPACYQHLKWLTGFSGSAGLALITQSWAVLFVDGRYTLQAAQEVDTTLWSLDTFKLSAIKDWILKDQGACQTIAYDPWLMTVKEMTRWTAWGAPYGITFTPTASLIDALWTNRPPLPQGPLVTYPLEYAGEDTLLKRQRLSTNLAQHQADWTLFFQLDSIAWLLNLRGSDIPTSPVFLAFAALDRQGTVHLWVDGKKIPAELENSLRDIKLHPYDPSALSFIFPPGCTVLLDAESTPIALQELLLEKGIKVIEGPDITLVPKALKNKTEQQGMIDVHRHDALALIRCLAWLEEAWQTTVLTELDVVKKLHHFRQQSPLFKGDSFDTIAASGPHGAIVHYKPSFISNRVLQKGELFLLDSGGQYWGGTTDVTRTIPLGPPSLAQRQAFTRVLKGHIRLASVRFPEGTTGSQLDALARFDLWQEGQDYAHGTGHGVGSYLSVHEGPQRISPSPSLQPLLEGMVVSNEPGYYLAEAFGIRIESLVMVKPSAFPGFFELDTLTLVPIDGRLIDRHLLTDAETKWLRDYHEKIRTTILALDSSLNSYLSADFFSF